jgi:hypothetical protein
MLDAKLGEEVEAVLRAEMDVEQDDGNVLFGHGCSGLGDGPAFDHGPAVELEVHPAEKSDRRVVVDDENGVTGRVHRGREVYA